MGSGDFFEGDKRDRGVNVTPQLHVVLRLGMNGYVTPIPYTPSWRAQEIIFSGFYLQ